MIIFGQMSETKLHTKTAEFYLDERGFLVVDFKQGDAEFDLEEAHRHLELAKSIANGRKLPVLVDLRNSYHMPSNEAKDYMAAVDLKSAEAIVVKSLHQRILANFFLKMAFSQNGHPTKVFTNRSKAIDWLLKYCK
jgi:hypothetical protein